MIKVLPLVGFKALRAMNAFHSLLLGLKMLPIHLETDYIQFFESFKDKTDGEKETALRQALAFVELSKEEISAVLSFTVDDNGIPFSSVNIAQLNVEDLFERIVAVCMEIGKIKADLVSEEEKKKLLTSPLISEELI